MFSLTEVVAQYIGSDRVSEMAERVAGRSRLGVWQRVTDRLPALPPAEARGYLRARGISVVREQTSRLIEQEGHKIASFRSRIEESAMQLLIEMISAQLGQRSLVRRRAA